MVEWLFVYGTLGPGRPNEHVLNRIGGSWHPATVNGILREAGWGAEMGYPGIDLHEQGDEIHGFVFMSANLSSHWLALDKREGDGYDRVRAEARINGNKLVGVFICALKS